MKTFKEYLGRGVDIFTHKQFQPPQQEAIVNIGDLKIDKVDELNTKEKIFYGSSYSDFIEKLSIEAGIGGTYSGFSGDLNLKFSTESMQSTTTKFIKIESSNCCSMYSIGEDKSMLKKHLTEMFLEAVEKQDVFEVFKSYGTHVAVKLNIGGMFEYYCNSKETTTISEHDFTLAAKAGFKSGGNSINGLAKLSTEEKSLLENINEQTSIDVYGGSPETRTSLASNLNNLAEWAKTIDDYPAFLGFTTDGLIGIWDLFDEGTTNYKKLKEAFNQLCAKNFQIRIFSSKSQQSNRPDGHVVVPENYKLLCGGAQDVYNGNMGNLLTASFPENNTWRAQGKDHVHECTACIKTYALAIYDPLDLWDVKIFEATSELMRYPDSKISIDSNFTLVGGGAKVTYQNQNPGNLLTASFPENNTWKVNAKQHYGESFANITAYAIGLRCKVDGIQINSKIISSTSQAAHYPTQETTTTNTMVGGGAKVDYNEPGNLLIASYPKDSKTWFARAKDHNGESDAYITAYAIELKVELSKKTQN